MEIGFDRADFSFEVMISQNLICVKKRYCCGLFGEVRIL